MNEEGLLYIISAPSGAGKTSLCREVVKFFPNLYHSVSYTTRLPRPGEKDGEDYRFVSKEKFQEMINDRRFVEWAEIHGNRYGTTIDSLKEYRHKGIDIILDIDGQGGRQLKNEYPDGIYVFILPPSLKDLEERLRLRSTDSNEDIEKRLKSAKEELQYIYQYDYIVLNDDFNEAISTLKSIIIAEKFRRERVLPRVKGLFQLP
ncbi:MAG: guanylate kinase [Thermodesulfobacteriota bacterium]